MKTYVACISGEAVLAFRAEDDDEARAMIDDQEGGMRSDLKALVGADGKPLWDGKSAIQAQEATAAQHAEWEQSRDQAISGEEIDGAFNGVLLQSAVDDTVLANERGRHSCHSMNRPSIAHSTIALWF